MKNLLLISLITIANTSCSGEPDLSQTLVAPEGMTEVDFAKIVLNELQIPSFQENSEFCGYIAFDENGDLVATPATLGRESSCLADDPNPDWVLIASYHTHGAFEYNTPAEFPSTTDMEGDEEEGVDGYISTPGGRFWYVDSSEMIVSQLCSVGCLTQDPDFVAGLDGDIPLSFTYKELKRTEME